ncbi:hypothetical protein PAPYR_11447 [Paratrimastix pyriformis]|uniref:Uncharacterized protein n=1 Tax=Paratrimastix pyriformis TaxID=342808 RepID=A0ABQ8U3Q3_9EUKA|nr:hypothetical protein PAPYR_11447 [Paratrimastix pyriformis]
MEPQLSATSTTVDDETTNPDTPPVTYVGRHKLPLTQTDPEARRREYQQLYRTMVGTAQRQPRQRRNIELAETDPIKREAEYQRKYKAVRQMERDLDSPVSFANKEDLLRELLDIKAELGESVPKDWDVLASLMSSLVFEHVMDRRRAAIANIVKR